MAELYVPESIMRILPSMVKSAVRELPPADQEAFVEEFRRRSKSLAVAYILWFLLGWHYAYLRKWGTQVLFWLVAGGLGVWWIIDLFRLPRMVRSINRDIAVDVMRDLKIIKGV